MKVLIENRNNNELQVVANMLKKQKIPYEAHLNKINVTVPNEAWFVSIKEAVEFMTKSRVSKVV